MHIPRSQRFFVAAIALSLTLPLSAHAADKQNGAKLDGLKPVTQERLLKGTDDTSNWLMYGGNYLNWRFSPLKDINRQNVKKMQAVWIFQTGIPGQLEAAPIVADGILYMVASYNHVYASMRTGEPLWKYDHPLPVTCVFVVAHTVPASLSRAIRCSSARSTHAWWRSIAKPARSCGTPRWMTTLPVTALPLLLS